VVQTNGLSGILPNGSCITISYPGVVTNKFLVVYRGTIGTTSGTTNALDPVDAGIGIAVNPPSEQTKLYSNWVPMDGLPTTYDYTTNGILESDDFPFALTNGNYEVIVNTAYFDDKGTIGSLGSTGPGTSCDGWGDEITNTIVPLGDISISSDGKRLQVQISATNDHNCNGNIGWGGDNGGANPPTPVSITWRAWPSP
jgi:hypothetical protein